MSTASSKTSKPKLWRYRGEPAKTFGSPSRVILTTIIIFIVTQFLAAAIAETALYATGRGGLNLDNTVAGQFIYVLVAEALAVGLVVHTVKRRGLGMAAIGLGRKPTKDDLVKAAMGFVAFYALLIVVTILASVIFPGLNTGQSQDLGFTNLVGPSDNFLAFLALVILPPLGEEPLVRGYLYSGLRSRWSFRVAMIVTSLIFGIAHLEFGSGQPLVWAAALDTFTLSLVLVYLRDKTGALYAGMLVHMLNNLVAFGVKFH